jgi:hypothetical protein
MRQIKIVMYRISSNKRRLPNKHRDGYLKGTTTSLYPGPNEDRQQIF